jgi:hypothetical protein
MIVLNNPKEGQEDKHNDWYTKRHLGDVVSIPGIVSAQRFVNAGAVMDRPNIGSI